MFYTVYTKPNPHPHDEELRVSLAPPIPMHASPLKVLHAGCGQMAAGWLQAAANHRDLEIIALVDLNLQAAERRRDEFAPSAAIGTNVKQMLERHRPDIVFNCTVPEAHLEVTLAAFRAGAHVLTEKPLAHSPDAARQLVAAAAKERRTLAVAQNYRHQPAARTVAATLASGAIGDLTALTCDFSIGAHFGGFRDEMEHVLLLDMSIHHFDLARLFSQADAEWVWCHEWNPAGSWYRHGANAQSFFGFSGGTKFSYRGSWCTEGLPTSWNGQWRFSGTKGSLSWNGAEEIRFETVAGNEGFLRPLQSESVPVRAFPGRDAGHASLIGEFVECLRKGLVPETHGADNLLSLAMVHAAIASAHLCKPVTVERGPLLAQPQAAVGAAP